jgi:biotin operon repressor
VTGSWASSFRTLPTAAVTLLRAMTILETATVVTSELATAMGVSETDVEAAVEELRPGGWVRQSSDGADILVNGARIWLIFDAADDVGDEEPDRLSGVIVIPNNTTSAP